MTTTRLYPCAKNRTGASLRERADVPTGQLALSVRQPWMVRVGRANVLIRGASTRDLTAVAAMHGRCSPASLLDRYRAGGRTPSPVAIEQMLRRTLSFVACTAHGQVVAIAVANADAAHEAGSADVGILVQDAWQQLGLGRELMTHLAGGAFVCGYTQLISYTATSVTATHRLLTAVGRTYSVPDPQLPHLHTYLTERARLGLGPVREQLAS